MKEEKIVKLNETDNEQEVTERYIAQGWKLESRSSLVAKYEPTPEKPQTLVFSRVVNEETTTVDGKSN